MRRQVSFNLLRVLLVVVLAAGLPVTAGAVDYIKDVMLIGGSSDKVSTLKTTLTGEGWTVIDVDLNKGCGSGSDYIYLLYKSESNADNLNLGYITDFYISDSEEALDAILYNGLTYHLVPFEGGSDFVSSKGDLNRGAGGAYIHLYFTKEAFHDQRTVSGIEIKTGEDNAAGALGVNGNTTTGYDLNAGARGKYIYMHCTNSPAMSVLSVTIDDDKTSSGYYRALPLALDTDYSFSQQIFTPDEIGMAGTITAISFRRDRGNLGAFLMEGVRVYLQCTDRESFSSNMNDLRGDREQINIYDWAYNGDFSAAEGSEWLTVTLDRPFAYNGQNNLLISIYDPTPGCINGSFGFTKHEVSAKRFYSLWCNAFYPGDNPDPANAIPFDSFLTDGHYHYNPESLCWCWVNDIRLNIVAADYLPRPVNPVLTDVTDKTATLSWDVPGGTGNSITGYAYQYKKASDATWSDEIRINSTTTSCVLTGLSAFTDYDFRVKAIYGSKESVTVSTRFTTDRGLPYDLGFEDGLDGWERLGCMIYGNEQDDWFWTTGVRLNAKHYGNLGFRFWTNLEGSAKPQYLISPRFGGTDPMVVSFYYKAVNTYPETFQVGYSTTSNDVNAFTWGNEITANQNLWAKYEADPFPVGTRYVAIKYISNTNALDIDDISFEAYSSYAKPTDISVSALTDQCATISWANQGATGCAYQYKKDSESTWSSEVIVNANTVTFNNLLPNTGYDFRVRALFSGDNASNYAAKHFVTEGPVESIPHYQDFENGMGGWRVLTGLDDTGNTGIEEKEGNRYFEFNIGDFEKQYLISPLLDASTESRLTFRYRQYSNFSAYFRVGYSVEATKDVDTDSWIWSETFTCRDDWQIFSFHLPANTKYVAIRWLQSFFLYVDDISIAPWEDNITATKASFYGEEKYLASFYSKMLDYELPEGTVAYTVAEDADGEELLFLRIGDGDSREVPAGTPVIIVADKEASETADTKVLPLVPRTLDPDKVSARSGNILQASDTRVTVTDGKIGDKTVYVLGIKDGVPGFYQFEGAEIPAGKAYILK